METLTLTLAKTGVVKATRLLPLALSAMLVLALITFSSCKPDPAPTPTEALKANVVGKTWTIQSVTVDGVDKTSLFTGMTLKFTDTGFTVTNPNPVWPASGSWTVNDAATVLTRNDNLTVDIDASASTLTLTLNWNKTTLGPGRVNSVEGQHIFVFHS